MKVLMSAHTAHKRAPAKDGGTFFPLAFKERTTVTWKVTVSAVHLGSGR